MPSFDANDVVFAEAKSTGNIKFRIAQNANGDVLEIRMKNVQVSKIWDNQKVSLWVPSEVYHRISALERELLSDANGFEGEHKSICRNDHYITIKFPDEILVASKKGQKQLEHGMRMEIAVQITGAWIHASTGHGLSLKTIAARELPKAEYNWD